MNKVLNEILINDKLKYNIDNKLCWCDYDYYDFNELVLIKEHRDYFYIN